MDNNTHKYVIVFDWDDTLICSWFIDLEMKRLDIKSITDFELNEEIKPIILQIEENSIQLIRKARELGHVYIITNSMNGWVELSAKKLFPKLWEDVKDLNIVSARSEYEIYHPADPVKWKYHAMKKCINVHLPLEPVFSIRKWYKECGLNMDAWDLRHTSGKNSFFTYVSDSDSDKDSEFDENEKELNKSFDTAFDNVSCVDKEIFHIISIGDSICERNAIMEVANHLNVGNVKSVKLIDRPSPSILLYQLQALLKGFEYIKTYIGKLDLMLYFMVPQNVPNSVVSISAPV